MKYPRIALALSMLLSYSYNVDGFYLLIYLFILMSGLSMLNFTQDLFSQNRKNTTEYQNAISQ